MNVRIRNALVCWGGLLVVAVTWAALVHHFGELPQPWQFILNVSIGAGWTLFALNRWPHI